jgi:hypothetical protein
MAPGPLCTGQGDRMARDHGRHIVVFVMVGGNSQPTVLRNVK